jgi:hypothetical protein
VASRISCGMIHRLLRRAAAVVVLAAACRGEVAPSEPPPATAPAEPTAASAGVEPRKEEATVTAPSHPDPPPPGPALAPEAVVPHFQRWWATWTKEHLATHPLRVTFDERVAAGGTVKAEACDVLAEHVAERAPAGSPELLYGDPSALRGRSDRCWWLHHDGMLSAGLGAALGRDGQVLVVWVVLEG